MITFVRNETNTFEVWDPRSRDYEEYPFIECDAFYKNRHGRKTIYPKKEYSFHRIVESDVIRLYGATSQKTEIIFLPMIVVLFCHLAQNQCPNTNYNFLCFIFVIYA